MLGRLRRPHCRQPLSQHPEPALTLRCFDASCPQTAGRLLDLLRRIYCFGLSLMKLDLRQESGRHTDCLNEVTE